jgi:purine-nucleoside phosphorylase
MMPRHAAKKMMIKGLSESPRVLIILGSAFGSIAECLTVEKKIPFRKIPGFPKVSAPTHSGNLLFGKMGRCPVLVAQGRSHVYEGHPVEATTAPVRLAGDLGIKIMITTNLAGGVNPGFEAGDFMVVEDHINLTGQTPLFWNGKDKGVFTDMFEAYSPRLMDLLHKGAASKGISLQRGVLAFTTGPSFETRAELKMLKLLGVDAVGWSLVPEVLEARRLGIESCGLACISDKADPDAMRPVDLEKLYQTGFDKAAELQELLFTLTAYL